MIATIGKIVASAVPILARDNFESDKVVNFNFRVSISSLMLEHQRGCFPDLGLEVIRSHQNWYRCRD